MPAADTATKISNLALDAVPCSNITSLSDGTREATLCGRHYPQQLQTLLEAAEWGFGVTRSPMVLTTNTRAGEWSYAYAKPSDMALAVRVVDPSYPLAGPYGSYGRVPIVAVPFADGGEVIFTNMPSAHLDYIAEDMAASTMPAYFQNALAAMVAAQIVLPITKDEKRRQLRRAEAAEAIALALAANFNREPRTYGDDWVPDVIMARLD